MNVTQELSQELVEPFVIAAHGNLARVRELLGENPALLNVPWEKFDETALQAASHMGNREIALYLLSEGAPNNICGAAMLGMADEVERFLREDPTLADARGAHGIPVLYHAALSGQTEVADLLFAHGTREGINGSLHAAIQFGHLAMVKWLLAHGVTNVNVPNFDNKTPLSVAVEKGYTEIVTLLEQQGGTMS
ncbi:MAG TPA: ankyrin repeat domain-containing protein [Chloroflexia bacterium]|nr:ankyrin repeat domain-containing protein [Chloroflexia bacterium]